MPFTNSLPIAAAYCTLGHRLTDSDPVSVVSMPNGDECLTFNFEADGADGRFSRQGILDACNAQPDAASTFDDLIAAQHPELLQQWHSALAAAAHRGAVHAQALVALCDAAPVMIASETGPMQWLFVNSDATPAQIREIAKL